MIRMSIIAAAVAAVLAVAAAALAAGMGAVRTNTVPEDALKLPVLMYHSILADERRSGKYVVTPAILEGDIKRLDELGYKGVNMQDLVNYVYNGEQLPEKPVLITFDDGNLNVKEYAEPILEKYGMKGVISIVGDYTDEMSADHNVNYSYASWDDINEMLENGVLEPQNHTYNLHSTDGERFGCRRKKYESAEEYAYALKSDIMKLQTEFKEHTGYVPNTFTYPFGAICPESAEPIREMGFLASLSCEEGMNYITRDKDCLYELKRYNRPSDAEREAFFEKCGIE